MFNLIKTSILGAILAKIVNFGLKPHIYDAKTDPFSLSGVDFFVYLKCIGIQIIEKIAGKIVSCVLILVKVQG